MSKTLPISQDIRHLVPNDIVEYTLQESDFPDGSVEVGSPLIVTTNGVFGVALSRGTVAGQVIPMAVKNVDFTFKDAESTFAIGDQVFAKKIEDEFVYSKVPSVGAAFVGTVRRTGVESATVLLGAAYGMPKKFNMISDLIEFQADVMATAESPAELFTVSPGSYRLTVYGSFSCVYVGQGEAPADLFTAGFAFVHEETDSMFMLVSQGWTNISSTVTAVSASATGASDPAFAYEDLADGDSVNFKCELIVLDAADDFSFGVYQTVQGEGDSPDFELDGGLHYVVEYFNS
jgi:hypothetical protein